MSKTYICPRFGCTFLSDRPMNGMESYHDCTKYGGVVSLPNGSTVRFAEDPALPPIFPKRPLPKPEVPKLNHVMLDFEAFGTGKSPCLSQVGAVYFDPTTGDLGPEFAANIDAVSHQKAGAILDAETVYWWLEQEKAAINSLLPFRQDVTRVMTDLNEFLKDAKYVWSHATFDFVLLQNTLKHLGIKPNVTYKAALDIRTLIHLSGTTTNRVRAGTHHNGLDDCKHQVKYCVEAITKLKLNKQAIKAIMNLGVVNE